MMKTLTMNPQMRKMSIHNFRTLQRPPSSQKISWKRFLSVQLYTGHLNWRTTLNFVFVHVQIHPNHGGENIISLLMMIMDARQLPWPLKNYWDIWKNEGDSTHKTISIYLETLNSFSQGHVGQDPGLYSTKKPDSDKKEKEEEEKEEENEEVAAALDSNDVSHEQVDIYACDHSKQGLETQIASDNHKDPVSEVIDGCQSAKKCTGCHLKKWWYWCYRTKGSYGWTCASWKSIFTW